MTRKHKRLAVISGAMIFLGAATGLAVFALGQKASYFYMPADLAGTALSLGLISPKADEPTFARCPSAGCNQRVGSGATRTRSLPKFSPWRSPMKAAGAFSSPSRMSSR